MNCDECKYYSWYYDKCTKWDCEVDSREVHNCYEPRETPIRDIMVGAKRKLIIKGSDDMELSKKEREIISLALIVYDNAISKQGNFEGLPTKEEILNLYYKILESK